MNRKIIIVLAAVLSLLLVTLGVSAEEISFDVVDYDRDILSVQGRLDNITQPTRLSMFVLNPQYEDVDISAENCDLMDYSQYYTQLTTDAQGAFEVKFKMRDAENKQNLPFRFIFTADNHTTEVNYYYYSKEQKDEYIRRINEFDTAAGDIVGLMDDLPKYMSLYNFGLYDKLHDKEAAGKQFMSFKTEPVTMYSQAIKLFKKAVVFEAVKEGLADDVCTGGIFIYDTELGLDENKKYYALYNEQVSDDGKKKVISQMYGSDTYESMIQNFKENALYAAMIYPTTNGYGRMFELMKDSEYYNVLKNKGMNSAKFEASNKSKVVSAVYSATPGSMADMVRRINIAAEQYPLNGKGGIGGGGSGSGGSGNKGSSFITGNSGIGSASAENENTQNIQPETVFTDLDSGHWAYMAVMTLYNKNIINGRENNTFAPNDNVTRAEFLKMLVVTAKLSLQDDECGFTDIDGDFWGYSYVVTGVKNGIASGMSEDTFGADLPITREQMAVMCNNVLKMYDIGAENSEYTANFPDSEEIADYAKESVNALKALGVISGNEEGRFQPRNCATRAEAAQFIYNILKAGGGAL